MRVFISMSASKPVEGSRVAVEFAKDDWSIGTILKITPTGYRVDFDYGETKLIKSTVRVVLVDQKRKLKKSISLAEVRQLKPATKAVAKTPAKPSAKTPTEKPAGDKNKDKDTKEELSLEHIVGDSKAFELAKAGSHQQRLNYLKIVWSKANAKLFSHAMNPPVFGFLKLMKNWRGVGRWTASTRQMRFSPRMFLASQAQATALIIHEMCHQAVSEIDKVVDRTRSGHGSNWESWMRRCKLDPKRYLDADSADEFRTDEELEKKERVSANKAAARDSKQHVKLPSYKLTENLPAQYHDPDKNVWLPGLLVDRHDQAGKRWMFILHPTATTWKIIPSDWFYELPKEQHAKYLSPDFITSANNIRAYKSKKAEQRTNNRVRKTHFAHF